jgi:hypothetical protein
VDWKFDEAKTTSKEELVRLQSKREIQHVHGQSSRGTLPMVASGGHDLPADEFIAPKRSRLYASAKATDGGVALAEMDNAGVPDDLGEIEELGPPPDLASIRPC